MVDFTKIKDKKVVKALKAWIELRLSKRWHRQAEAIRYNALPRHKRKFWDDKLLQANVRMFNARSAYNHIIDKLTKEQIVKFSEEATRVRI